MDGTLIEEDVTEIAVRKSVLHPLYWPLFIWACLLQLPNGQAGFRFLEHRMPLRPQSELTYNTELVRLLESHRARGGKIVLATASHVSCGKKVVEQGNLSHLFDDVWGSCMKQEAGHVLNAKDNLNLAASAKARRLDQLLAPASTNGAKGFLYAGNSRDDLEVWSHPACLAMLLVNCDDDVLHQALKIPKPRLVIPQRKTPRAIIANNEDLT
ncbi:hypothetical protein ACA910_001764 [Epithemia clementina (nom. ined.)]